MVAAGALVLTGCTPPYESNIIEGTEITVAWNDLIDDFNTNSASGNNTANSNVNYVMNGPGFIYYDNEPSLVQNTNFGTYEKISDDPLQVKYTINKGIKWSDGAEVDEADLVLAWTTIFDSVPEAGFQHANPRADLSTEFPKVEDNSITITYDSAYVDWETQFDIGVAAHGTVALAYPEITDAEEAKKQLVEAVESKDSEWLSKVAEAWNGAYKSTNTPDNPLVSLSRGPFLLETLVEEEYVTLVTNPDYKWGPSPFYERITIRQIEDSTAQLQGIENGDIQVAAGQPTADTLTLAEGLANADFSTGDEGTYEHIDLTFNNGGPFDPATYGGDEAKAQAVRIAFLKTIPRQQIIDNLIKPLNSEASTRDSILVIPGGPGYAEITAANGSADYAEVDIDGAKALLAEAGVTVPLDVKFWYPEGNVRRGQEFELIAASAALAGFNVIDDSEPTWAFTDTATTPINPHDAVIFGWQSTSLALTGSDQYTGTGQPSNFGGYSNTEVDGLLKSLETELDPQKQVEIQLEIEKHLWADGYGVTLFQFPSLTVWNSNVKNIKASPLAPTYFWNFWEWAPADAK